MQEQYENTIREIVIELVENRILPKYENPSMATIETLVTKDLGGSSDKYGIMSVTEEPGQVYAKIKFPGTFVDLVANYVFEKKTEGNGLRLTAIHPIKNLRTTQKIKAIGSEGEMS